MARCQPAGDCDFMTLCGKRTIALLGIGPEIMIGFMKAIMKMPFSWRVWVMLLVAVNLIVPLFYIQTQEAQLTIAAILAGTVTQSYIHAKLGFVRLLGIGHIFWVPLVIWLAFRAGTIGLDSSFGIWLASLVLINTISLVIDAIDVIRFLSGETSPTLAS